jgi:GR25 family glycosyltransferase involved in LPS biosynthesis
MSSVGSRYLLIYLLIAISAIAVYVMMTNTLIERFGERAAKQQIGDDNFYPIYIINLDRRTDRLHETVKLLNEKGYDINQMTRVKATDGAAEWETLKTMVSEDALVSIYAGYRTAVHQLSKGGVGCYVSHLKLWGFLLNESVKEDAILVLEDDTLPTLEVNELKRRLEHAPEDWDIILLGATYDNCMNVNPYFCRIKRFFGTHGYLIRKETARYLVPKALPISQQIDSWMSDLSENGDINVYALRNSGWTQNEKVHSTDIQIPLIEEDG